MLCKNFLFNESNTGKIASLKIITNCNKHINRENFYNFFNILALIKRNVLNEQVLVILPISWQQFVTIVVKRMLLKIGKIVLAIVLSFTFTFSLWKLIIFIHTKYFDDFNSHTVDNWLEQNELGAYKKLFRDLGE